MATTTGALPKAPYGIGDEASSTQEYLNAVDKVIQSLDARANAGPNMWNVAAQFFNPGRTGTFGEALGNVAGSVGRDVERQQEAQIPLAQMKAQMAGQKYQVRNEAEAMDMLARALGTDTQTASSMVQSGDIPPDVLSKIPSSVYLAINKKDPKLGEGLKNAFGMDVERRKLINQDVESGLKYADLAAKYGSGVLSYLTPTARAKVDPTGALTGKSNTSGTSTSGGTSTNGQSATRTAPSSGGDVVGGGGGESLETKQSSMKERSKSLDKQYEDKITAITTYEPGNLARANRELRELYNIADKHGDVLGLLQSQGVIAGLAAAAEKGVQIGQFGAVSFPVEEFLAKYKLPPEKQAILTRATQILANQFFENAKANKAVLGPSISNSDVMLLKAPVATASDSAEALKYYVKQNLLTNRQRADIYDAYTNHMNRVGTSQPFSTFFSSNNYRDVFKRYEPLFSELEQKHSPVYSTAPAK